VTKSIFTAAHFNDEATAYAYVEARIWANGRVCPHCGVYDRSGRLTGKGDRPGLYKCYACRKKFTVKMGTVFEDSHIHMRDWLTAIHLIFSSKKAVSSNQLHRTLGITLKSAWFMSHRIREAMRPGPLAPMRGEGSIVEIDETFIGKKEGAEVRRGGAHKNVVLSLAERGGSVRSFQVESTKREDIIPIVKANIAKETHVMTDESNTYSALGKDFAAHGSVDHGREEWGYTDRKTGMKGQYQLGGRLLFRFQARHDRRLSALRRKAFTHLTFARVTASSSGLTMWPAPIAP
jgi:transposase-like protein